MIKKNIVDANVSNFIKKQDSSINDVIFESRISSSLIDNKTKEPPSEPKEQGVKRGLLKLKTKNQQVTNHIS
jgi:hypothetical protein